MELIAKGGNVGGSNSTESRSSGYLTSPKGGSSNHSQTNEQSYLKKLTHLYLQDKNIEEISGLSLCKNLLVLYLYDNKITSLPFLGFAKSLTHLYLQNNLIDRMENLKELKSLTKLYIGGNQIIVVEGLELCENLKELHVEQQQMPPGEKLIFDPRTIRGIAPNLEVLNVSGNRMESLEDLVPLRNLRHLMANDNFFESVNEVAGILGGFHRMEKAELLGNPCVSKARYRERVVNAAHSLQVLDGKEITSTMRQFVTSLATRRREATTNKQSNINNNSTRGNTPAHAQEVDAENSATFNFTGGGDPSQNGTVVPSYVMPRLPHRRFEEILARAQTMPHTDDEEGKGGAKNALRSNRSSAKGNPAKTRLSVVNYIGPGSSAFMADPNDDRLRTSMALKVAYEAASEADGRGANLMIGGGGGTFMGAVRSPVNGGVGNGHR